jgi:hypothetical protein
LASDLDPSTYVSWEVGMTDAPCPACLFRWVLANFLPGLPLNFLISVSSSWDYRWEPPCSAANEILKRVGWILKCNWHT